MDGDSEDLNWDWLEEFNEEADRVLDLIDAPAKTDLDPVNLVVFDKEEGSKVYEILPYLTDKTANISIPITYYMLPFTSHEITFDLNHN